MTATSQIAVIRPEPGLAATLAAGARCGLDLFGFPLSNVCPLDWDAPDPAEFDGLLMGSANALRHGGEQLQALRHLPLFAVGSATAEAARELGFTVAGIGEGGLQQVVVALPDTPCRLLRLAGEEHVALDLPRHVTLTTCVIYRVEHLPLPFALEQMLRAGCLVLLHSAGSARHLAAECDRLAIDRGGIALAALGPRILAAAGQGWREGRSAAQPDDIALLALARDMCHERR